MSDYKVLCETEFFEIVQYEKKAIIEGQNVVILRELVRRPPGVRAIVLQNEQVLLAKEYRYELDDWDYRLPGGKVFESLYEYRECNTHLLPKLCEDSIIKELREEVGIIARNPKLIRKSVAGARIEWNLYYFVVFDFDFDINGPNPEYGEFITVDWVSYNEAITLCLEGKIHEDRSVSILLQYLLGKNQ